MSQFRIDQALFRSIPADLMLRYGFVPYRRDGAALVIVVSDPTDLPTIDELAVVLSTPIKVMVGTPSAIQSILKKSESSQRVLEEATEGFQMQLLREEENGEDTLTVERLTSDASPVIRLVDSTIFTAIQRRASDIHIETQDEAVHVKYRIDGVLQPAMRPIDKKFHSTIISRIKVMAELDIAEKRVPQDGRFKVRLPEKTIDFRVSIMPSVHGEDAVIRILDKESISEQFHELRLDILGFPERELKRFRKYIAEPYGMVLVTGPTGSGKTTTLYAALSEIKSIEDKIITIEDPVEYQLRGITQIPINEKKGLTFARGLRSILRHDPDKIMVGEIRDPETAQIAIQSALTGHLVFTTVHANNVLDVLGRFLNMGVEPYQFVSALNCVLAQRLVRTICAECKRPVDGDARDARGVGARPRARAHAHLLRGRRLHRVRGHGLQGPHRDLRAAGPVGPDPRDDPRPEADVGNQEGRARGGHALPPRVGARAGAHRHDDPARDQQGDLRRMSPRLPFGRLFASPPPHVGVELTARRVTVVALGGPRRCPPSSPATPASRCRPARSCPAPERRQRRGPGRRCRSRSRAASTASALKPRRVGLVVPDPVAKVSLVRFERVPARGQDLAELVRWQVRKAAPFRIEDAQVAFTPGPRAARRRPRVRRHPRAPRHRRGVRARVRVDRGPRRPRRPRELQPDQRRRRLVGRGAGRRLAARAQHARLHDARHRARRAT